jgi:type III restriction enzyme
MRIAENQDGERVHGFDVNRLTVMANESYEDFARQLQKEIEEEEGIKFGVVEPHLFANIPIPTVDHRTEYLGVETSQEVWDHLKAKGYIDANGKVQDSLRTDLKTNSVDLPEELNDHAAQITAVLRKVAGSLNIKNANDRKQIRLNKAVFLGEEFKQLWERIKYRTTFRVDFDVEKLIEECSDEIGKRLIVGRARFISRKARLKVDQGGVRTEVVQESTHVYEAEDYQLPDVVSYLQNETNLTRRTLVEIMTRNDRLEDFKKNPQKYIEQVSAIIKRQMRLFIVDGIKYQRLGDDYYYAQELFEENELYGYLSKNMLESEKSVFDHVVYDSDVEEEFARSFERSDNVKVYAKLPGWFRIDTPLGTYNPDWAVLVEMDGQERLYFVVETKGSQFTDVLRPTEQAKIDCGKEHFKALGSETEFVVADSYETFIEQTTR